MLLACTEPQQLDYGQVCASVEGDAGQPEIVVHASSGDCAGDHVGASFECTVAAEGSEVVISTVFEDGADPNGACAGPLTDTCAVEVEAGVYTLSFGGESGMLTVPGGEQVCFPGGGSGGTEG